MTGETILVVEDEGLIALHLMELLEKEGYRVTGLAYSGEMVLKSLEKSKKPDLILMDIGLAGSIDGIETARQIRQRYEIPLIFVTAYTSEGTFKRMQEVAPDGVIFKPFLDHDLLALIRKAVDKLPA
jgi:two-component system, response regulator PdtaR